MSWATRLAAAAHPLRQQHRRQVCCHHICGMSAAHIPCQGALQEAALLCSTLENLEERRIYDIPGGWRGRLGARCAVPLSNSPRRARCCRRTPPVAVRGVCATGCPAEVGPGVELHKLTCTAGPQVVRTILAHRASWSVPLACTKLS